MGAAAPHQSEFHPRRVGRVRARRPVLAAALSRRQGPGVPPVAAATGGARGAAQARQAVESRSAPGSEAGCRVDLFSWREHMYAWLRICLAWLCASALAPCVAA